METEGPRHAVINADDHGALLSMTTWFLACVLVLCIATRLIVRYTSRNVARVDDVLIVIAATLALGGATSISLAVRYGLGRRIRLIDPTDLERIHQTSWASHILYVLTIGTTKASITWFFGRLACETIDRVMVMILGVAVAGWTLAATFTLSFACGLPRPWYKLSATCVSFEPFWFSMSAVDILIDLAMIALPIHMIWRLRIGCRKKITVCLIFAVRGVLIVVSIHRLLYLPRLFSSDPTYDSISYSIATECHATLSVIIACTPALKPFVESVKNDILQISLPRPKRRTSQNTFAMHTLSRPNYNEYMTPALLPPLKNNRTLSIYSQTHNTSGADADTESILVQDETGKIVKQYRPIARASSPPPPSSPLSPPPALNPNFNPDPSNSNGSMTTASIIIPSFPPPPDSRSQTAHYRAETLSNESEFQFDFEGTRYGYEEDSDSESQVGISKRGERWENSDKEAEDWDGDAGMGARTEWRESR